MRCSRAQLVVEAALALGVGEQRRPIRWRSRTRRGGRPGRRGSPSAIARWRLAGAGRVGVELLMLWIRCRRGCGWWPRRAGCAGSSSRCSGGGPRTAETALICRLLDGSAGTVPARWTDLPGVGAGAVAGCVGSPAGVAVVRRASERPWRRRPGRGGACGENGGRRCRGSSRSRRASRWCAAAVWETLPVERQIEVTVRLARLLARAGGGGAR